MNIKEICNNNNIVIFFRNLSLEKRKMYFFSLFLFIELLILAATLLISHISEHILIAAGIGYISIIIFIPLSKIPLFTLGWYSGTLYYLGRTIRDYETENGNEHTENFDVGGFLGPCLGNIITFGISYQIYINYIKDRDKISDSDTNTISDV